MMSSWDTSGPKFPIYSFEPDIFSWTIVMCEFYDPALLQSERFKMLDLLLFSVFIRLPPFQCPFQTRPHPQSQFPSRA